MADRATRVCVISRDRLRGADFIAALQASLNPGDPLEIIIDRRQRGSSGLPDLEVDRRQLHQVALALEASGFAIVPASADRMEHGAPPSLPRSETQFELPSSKADRQFLESGSNSGGRPSDTVMRILGVLSGLTMTALVLLLPGRITEKNLIGQLLGESPRMIPSRSARQINTSFTDGQISPTVSEMATAAKTPSGEAANYSPARTDGESGSACGPAQTISPPDRDGLTPGYRETSSPSEASNPARREPRATPRDTVPGPEAASSAHRVVSAGSNEIGVPPKAGAEEGASGGHPRLSVASRPTPKASVPSKQATGTLSPEPATPDATPTPSERPLHAELLNAPLSRGWGNSYVVRLLNSAGQPMQVFGVLLVAQMADGGVEETAMGTLAEQGVYRATVPTGRSTPVDLRVRVRVRMSTGDRFIEIPVTR